MKTPADYSRAYRERQEALGRGDELRAKAAERGRQRRRARGLKKPGCKNPANKLTKEAVVEQFRAVHGDLYDYPGEYTSSHVGMVMSCCKHGEFTQTPANHKKGAGCPQCGIESRGRKKTLGTEEFIARSREVHGFRYDYSAAKYSGSFDEVVIICHEHGEFRQMAQSHYRGSGCPQCAADAKHESLRMTVEEFVSRSKDTHGDLYEYPEGGYASRLEPARIICKKHGEFFQIASYHMNGCGCPQCGNSISRGEIEVAEFCRSIIPGVETRNRTEIKPLELDIYIPAKNLAIEYCGVYWHSDLVKYNHDVKTRHQIKWSMCAERGIRLITIYEDDWADRGSAVRAVIESAIKETPSIHGRECTVSTIDNRSANDFHNLNHVQGAPHIGTHYALSKDGVVVAVMTFSASASGRGYDGWELTRFSSSIRISGGASKLFSAFLRDKDPETVRSYSDNRYFTGAMYPKLGFSLESERPPSYRVVNPRNAKTYHQRMFQRKYIPQRLAEIGSKDIFDPDTDRRTEHEVCTQNGFGRIYDCGKKRWLWTKPSPCI